MPSSPEELDLAFHKLAELVKLKRTDLEAYKKELERMFPGSKTLDPEDCAQRLSTHPTQDLARYFVRLALSIETSPVM
jgi:hypothetical protein